jgi:hypothetical protein
VLRFSSRLTQGDGAEATVYEAKNIEDPMFFIDIWSAHERLGGLLAHTFVGLLAAFRELAPLVTRSAFVHQIDEDVAAMVAKARDPILH